MNKEFYLAYAEQHFSGKALELVKKSIEIDYNDDVTIPKALAYMKSKLPDCYLCSLDGKVIVGNR